MLNGRSAKPTGTRQDLMSFDLTNMAGQFHLAVTNEGSAPKTGIPKIHMIMMTTNSGTANAECVSRRGLTPRIWTPPARGKLIDSSSLAEATCRRISGIFSGITESRADMDICDTTAPIAVSGLV